jgi:unsaturated pyranuronate lyase
VLARIVRRVAGTRANSYSGGDEHECSVGRIGALGAFEDIGRIPPQRIWEGVVGRSVHGEGLTLGVVELEPDSVVPEHSHANEQLGIVLAGSVMFRVANETRELGAGGTWRIPADVPHEVVTGPEGAVVLDVFAPARDDWKVLEQLERKPRWP